MSDREEKLERLLRSRRIEPASPDFAQRIILAAAQRPQGRGVPFWPWLRDVFREFHLPQPSYVLAGALLIGVAVGFSAPAETTLAGEEPVGIQSYLSADEVLL